MSFDAAVNKWLFDFRKAHKADPNFKVENWLGIAWHVLNDFPCRPISEPRIEKLFFRQPVPGQVSTKDITEGHRAFIYMEDNETDLIWRFTMDFTAKHISARPVRGEIVSAYPKDKLGIIYYPNKSLCCKHNSSLKKCEAFLRKTSHMP